MSPPNKEQSHLTGSDTSENTIDHSCSANKSSSLETTQKSQPNEEQPHLTNPDIIAVTETWLSDNIFDNEILPNSYSIFIRIDNLKEVESC